MFISLFFFTDYTHYAVLLWPLLKWNIWLRSLSCFSSLTTLTTAFYFTTIKMKDLTTLTTLFYFTTIQMKYLTTVAALFFFTNYTHCAILLHYYQMEISDYAHYAVLLSPLWKWNIWLRSPRCFFSLTTIIMLLYFTTIKFKYLTTLTMLFFFTDCTHYALLLHYY